MATSISSRLGKPWHKQSSSPGSFRSLSSGSRHSSFRARCGETPCALAFVVSSSMVLPMSSAAGENFPPEGLCLHCNSSRGDRSCSWHLPRNSLNVASIRPARLRTSSPSFPCPENSFRLIWNARASSVDVINDGLSPFSKIPDNSPRDSSSLNQGESQGIQISWRPPPITVQPQLACASTLGAISQECISTAHERQEKFYICLNESYRISWMQRHKSESGARAPLPQTLLCPDPPEGGNDVHGAGARNLSGPSDEHSALNSDITSLVGSMPQLESHPGQDVTSCRSSILRSIRLKMEIVGDELMSSSKLRLETNIMRREPRRHRKCRPYWAHQ